jgi:predicted nucleotidyltransferase component of viral defense system
VKDHALALVEKAPDRGQALNTLREYLQALVLRSFHESEAFRCLAFVGGTALRFLHGLPRFSEDLDFSVVSPEGYVGHARRWTESVRARLLGMDMKALLQDVGPFLERPTDAGMISRDNLLALLEARR